MGKGMKTRRQAQRSLRKHFICFPLRLVPQSRKHPAWTEHQSHAVYSSPRADHSLALT